jgi:ATP-dependent helicase/nuclease subunit A
MAYAEMLRSPFAGLSLPGTAVCLSIFKDEPFEPFNDTPLEHLNETDRKKYICGQRVYRSIFEKAKNENISSLVSELWYNEGYCYETYWNKQTSVYSELYDYLFYLAVKADSENKTLASFTDTMCSLRDSSGRLSEMEIPLERQDAVRLMTIHKSKGLEFPVVFLCGCGKKSQPDRVDTVYYSNETGLVFSPPVPYALRYISGKRNNFFFQRSNNENKQKRTAELRRLLYVGMTRAEKELYITGSLGLKTENETENISVALKNYIEDKCSGNKNTISGDTIIDNDTFFGLLLPSITYHIPQGGIKNNSSFFNLEEIPVYTEGYVKTNISKATIFTNDQRGLNEYIKLRETYYKNVQIIKTPVIYDNHITPVSLKETENEQKNTISGNGFIADSEYSGERADDVLKKTDSILERYLKNNGENNEKVNSASFGTIVHFCVEAALKKDEPVIHSGIVGFLSPSEMDILLEAGKELARRFIHSPLGKIAVSSNVRESEFPFRSIIKNNEKKEIFINGTIDLFFEYKDCIHIVDFKTDSIEMPNKHIAQMACYFQAVYSLFVLSNIQKGATKKECRVWLYYLRTGNAVEITEITKNFNLEKHILEQHTPSK